jgi:hypothetical protein
VSQDNQIIECEAALNSRNDECKSLKIDRDELFEKLEATEASLVAANAEIVSIKAVLLQTQVPALLTRFVFLLRFDSNLRYGISRLCILMPSAL